MVHLHSYFDCVQRVTYEDAQHVREGAREDLLVEETKRKGVFVRSRHVF